MDIDKLDDIVNEYNNTYRKTSKMKPIDVKYNTYIGSSKDVNDKEFKFKVGDYLRIFKYKNIFAKRYTPNWSNDLNGEEIIGTFYEKELQRLISKNLGKKK